MAGQPSETDEVKSMHIAVYALSLLGGAHKKIHTEDVAEKCLQIAPDRFRWERYNYPDKELVRKALFHASEKKNGALVVGRAGMEQRGKSRDGWLLTAAGAEWLRGHESILGTKISAKVGSVPKREADRFLKQIHEQDAYNHFSTTGNLKEVSQYMFTDMLNCSPDASRDVVRAKFDRIVSMAQLVNDESILSFLQACAEKFETLFGRTATPVKEG